MFNQSEADLETVRAEAEKAGSSLKVGVIADSSGKFCSNGLRFEPTAEGLAKAVKYGWDLSGRWMAVREWRVEVA